MTLVDMIYPINSVVFRYDNQSPEDFLGGEWEELSTEELKIVTHNYTSDYVGKGTSTVILTEAQMPSHNHNSESGSSEDDYRNDHGKNRHLMADSDTGNYAANSLTYYTGGNEPHNNIPTYIIVRAWKRIK